MMKNLILLFSIILLITACSQSDENEFQDDTLYGTWRLIEAYGSDAGKSPQWNQVKNGYTYTFNTDHSFTSTRFAECLSGTYEFTADDLTLTFTCDGFNTGIEDPSGTFVEAYSLEDNHLILVPTYLNCDEGCLYKFEKIK